MPKRLKYFSNRLMVEPNTLRDTSTWSPALHRLITSERIADMPVEVATACSAPSSAAMRSSKVRTVGLV
ncbi:hypothetical protein D3C76_1010170 [compost metagenome]